MKFLILFTVLLVSFAQIEGQGWPREFSDELRMRTFKRSGSTSTTKPRTSISQPRRSLVVFNREEEDEEDLVVTTPSSSTTMKPKKMVVENSYSDYDDIEEDENTLFLLPASSKKVLTKRIDESLVCPGSGLYADINNNCEVFHHCVETARPDGTGYDMRQYSFFCGQNTIFDQYTLNCRRKENAVPCEYAAEFFSINERITQGKRDVLIHREDDKLSTGKYFEESMRRANLN